MSDLIERQAAIEIIQNMYPGMPRVPWLRKEWQERYEPYIRVEKEIRKLPAALPEIIRCKDCIFHGLCRASTRWAVVPKDNWYCADAERKNNV